MRAGDVAIQMSAVVEDMPARDAGAPAVALHEDWEARLQDPLVDVLRRHNPARCREGRRVGAALTSRQPQEEGAGPPRDACGAPGPMHSGSPCVATGVPGTA